MTDVVPEQHLKMSELAQRSGVSTGTIKHYLREGLLGAGTDIVRTSRNMAYYPPDYVERVQLIKRLQEDRFMPLAVIRELIESDVDRARAIAEAEDRIIERALEVGDARRARLGRDDADATYRLPKALLTRLVDLGVLTPDERGYDPDDVAILAAMTRFRAGGYEERLGFTAYDTLRYKEALEPLVREEVRVLLERLPGEVDPERAVEIIEAGAAPLRELVGALHSKLLLAELARVRDRRATGEA